MYLARMKSHIALDKTHPRNQGVKMQAHHLISGKGMAKSELGEKIEGFGYDINLRPNLVFLPCTLQGACHLGIQPHRGNHDTAIPDQEDYDDDTEPRDYHRQVSDRLQSLHLPLNKECNKRNSDKVIDELNKLSKIILEKIVDDPGTFPLTRLYALFGARGLGCGGVDNVAAHSHAHACPVGRDHLWNEKDPSRSQGPSQAREKITFKTKKKYEFEVGR
jgi:hypothetical protein